MKDTQPIQSGWSQLAIVSAALLTILSVLWVGFAYEWQELYYRDIVIPRLQVSYGFQCGQVRLVRGSHTVWEGKGIVSVVPGGRGSRMGLRAGDAPFEYHGGGFTAMYHALKTADDGGFAAFDVVNADDWNAGREGFRTVAVYPRVREVPVSMSNRPELPSPVGSQTVVAVQSGVDHTRRELWVWDSIAGSRTKVWDFRDFALGTWSADGGWVAVTDKALGAPSRCVLIDARGGKALNLADTLTTLPGSVTPTSSSDRLDCEIFGWVQDNPTRVAVVFRNYGAKHGDQWIYDFFFDVATRRIFAAGSQ